jgi:hypothetical protein
MKKGDMVRLKKSVQRTGKREKALIRFNYRSGVVVLDKPIYMGLRMWNRVDLEECK